MANPKQDMGTKNVKLLMLQLAVPAVIGQLINLLYNIVDRIYIGHIPEIGGAALTGVGLFTPFLMLITAFAMMIGSGGAPRAAIAMGQGDKERAELIVGNSFSTLVLLAAVLTPLFYASAPTMLRLFGGSDKTLPYAVEYGRIYILGMIFVLIVMGMNPFITTQGFSKVSMMTIVIGAVINIVLDPILIFVLDMGVKGAAIATVISQAVGALWSLRFLSGKKAILRLKKSTLPIKRHIIVPCLTLGISMFVMISTESLLAISFTTNLSKYAGDVAVGAMTVINSISQLLIMPLSGICQGGQPIISYNYGAGNTARVKEAFWCQFTACVVYTAGLWASIMLFPQVFAGIFTPDKEIVEYTTWALRIFMVIGFMNGFQIACQQAFLALGQAKMSLLMACLRKLVLLIPLIFILPCFFQNKGFAVFLAEPVSDFLACATTVIAFFALFPKILRNGPQQ